MADLNQSRRPSIGAFMRAGNPSLSPQDRRAGWGQLKAALDRRSRSGSRRLMVAAVATLGATAAIGVGATISMRSSRKAASEELRTATEGSAPLTYAVESGEARSDGRTGNTERRGRRLRFSDGSHVDLAASARAEVVSVESRGARIALDDGEVSVVVVHRPSTRWRLDAGPFSVFVEGTSFTLGWSAADERLQLHMQTGTVTVKGPIGTDPIRVRGGETLSIRLPERQIQLEGAGASQASSEGGPSLAPPTTSPPSASTMGASLTPPPPPPSSSPSSTKRAPSLPAVAPTRTTASDVAGSRWRQLVAAGRFTEVVEDAENRGLRATLAAGGRDDLTALADAARYSRRNDVSRRALHALRDRFPASDAARDAAFFLGRQEEADNPRSSRCLEWYRRYRAETPHGLYVEDSLGREMLIMERLYSGEEARAIARKYLVRFPNGHLATRAAEIAGGATK